MTDLVADLRTALRQWTRRPLLPATAAVTLATGLGAATAVFAVAWAVVWRPLDVVGPDRLVWIDAVSAGEAQASSPGATLTWQAEARTIDALGAVRPVVGAMADRRGTDRLPGALVSASLGAVLGVAPVLGRGFTADDDAPGAPRVLLLAHDTWRTRYRGASDVIGRAVTLDGRPATIVGVLPESVATVVPGADWWAPLALAPSERSNIGPRYLRLIGRLAPGASLDAATEELTAIGTRLGLRADDGSPLGVRVTRLADHLTAPHRPGLVLLLAGVFGLVLIACANVATLLVTRAQERQAELALRASLGASRGRLVRQLLVEAALLATLASAGGLVAALWLVDVLKATLPADLPRLDRARIDAVSAGFALAAGVLVTFASGLAPALGGARVDLQSVLRLSAAGAAGPERVRRWFVAAQMALAVVLAGAGALVVQSAAALAAAPRGYDAAGVVTTSLTLPAASYRDATAIAGAVNRLLAGTGELPAVRSAAAASQVPFAGGSAGSDVALAGQAFTDGVDRQARVRLVSAGYLRTLGITIVEGREIGPEDGAATSPVVVVNQALARRLSPDRSLVGRQVRFGVPVFNGADGQRVWQVVGVAADTWDRGPRVAVEPEALLPIAQTPPEVFSWISRELQVAVRTPRDAASMAADLRRVVAGIDPALPVGTVRTLEVELERSYGRERLLARLLSGLGLAGVALALLGLVAVVHHQVRRQRRDIAIRLAIGATTGAVVRRLVTDGARVALVGAVVGIAGCVATGGLLTSLLYGVAPGDPVTLATVALGVVAVAVIAAWLPARSAMAVDPADALRG